MQPFPWQDSKREGRVIQDVLDVLRDNTVYDNLQTDTSLTRRIKRWITHVLNDANRRKWWFLENVATTTLAVNQDIVDLRGHIDKITAVYCPQRLNKISLAEITNLRQSAATNNSSNAATKATHYAIEAGHRIHLWPAPSASISFAVLYTRNIHVAIIPDSWEVIILNGIIGLYGQHFDRDALVDNHDAFETRYERQLARAKSEHHDIEIINRFKNELSAVSTVVADSSTDTGTDVLMPASLTGIGYETIETGDYPLTVP